MCSKNIGDLMKLNNMTWTEAVEKCKDKIILIPHGSTEEHGYHLPLKTDALVAEKVCEIFYDSEEVVVAPVMNYTGLKSTKQMPGTVGPNPEEYEIWMNTVVSDFMKLNPKKVFFFFGHDGSTERNVINKMIEEYGEKLDYAGSSGIDKEAHELGITESTGHGGEGETSLMLYLDPENVKMDKAVDDEWPENYSEVGISKSGAHGKPTKGTAEKGKKLLDFYRERLREALE